MLETPQSSSPLRSLFFQFCKSVTRLHEGLLLILYVKYNIYGKLQQPEHESQPNTAVKRKPEKVHPFLSQVYPEGQEAPIVSSVQVQHVEPKTTLTLEMICVDLHLMFNLLFFLEQHISVRIF